MSPFVLLSSLCPSSSSHTKSVCNTINTPEIIGAATNAAERGMKDGGACDGVMSSQSICGVNSDRGAFQRKSGAADLVAGGTM